MKNQLPLFVATLATLFVTLTASAQGEWKWAHYWTGGDGTLGSYYNEITNTAFDEEGNIYVYGSMGGSPQFDGLTFLFVNNGTVLDRNDHSILLAKFDTLGNMLWFKVVKNNASMSRPHWMEIKGNQIYISGNYELESVDYNMNNVWLYFLDTLIRGYQVHDIPIENRTPPYRSGLYTFFTVLDLDGHVIENHFIEAFSRELDHNTGQQAQIFFCDGLSTSRSPFHVDSEGNVHVFTQISYFGNEGDPYSIVIDCDTNKKYDFYFSGNADPWLGDVSFRNGMMYKFSPSWNLVSANTLVDTTDGIATSFEFTGDSVSPRYIPNITGLSFDEQDNMYLSGYIQLVMFSPGMGAESHNYPIHIWFDESHNIVINDITAAEYCNFIVKYDRNGNVLWTNQIHTFGGDTPVNGSARCLWNGNDFNDNSVYILGTGAYNDAALIYFDDPNHPLQRYQNTHSGVCFFVRYDATTGYYVNHGIAPALNALSSTNPTVINNRVFALSRCNSNTEYWLSMWRNDGLFIKADTIHSVNEIAIHRCIGTCANESGYLMVSLTAKGSVSFDNNVSVNCPSEHSNAVFALYHNPEFTQPFVPDDSVGIDEYYQNREREIYLYPNPTDGRTTVCGYMYGYRSIELLDLQGRKLATLMDSPHGTSLPEIDLSPYPSGTYLVKINFERGVSVVRKVVRM